MGMTGTLTMSGYWDERSATYDEDVDHGLTRADAREAWRSRLRTWVPGSGLRVLDLGSGTGSLSRLLAEAGHRVTGVDLAAEMVRAAEAKCADLPAERRPDFVVGDAAAPPIEPGSIDVVLTRHVTWTLPDPHAALAGWVRLLRPGGRLVLVEGRWGIPRRTPATADAATAEADAASPYAGDRRLPWGRGVSADELVAAVTALVPEVRVEELDHDPVLWGRPVDDERYAVVATVGG